MMSIAALTSLLLVLTGCQSLPLSVTTPIASACTVVNGKADRQCTPGAINPDVTQANIAQTICVSGWTKTVRPSVTYTNLRKTAGMQQYNEPPPPKDYEEDHLIPLEIGGSPTSPMNLWPEPWDGTAGAHAKDAEENQLHRAVCSLASSPGHLSLAAAQAKIVADWTHLG